MASRVAMARRRTAATTAVLLTLATIGGVGSERVERAAVVGQGDSFAGSGSRFGLDRAVASNDVRGGAGASATVSGITTKVMENGVPVLVAGGRIPAEQVVSSGQVLLSPGTLTLPAVPLSDVMSLSPSVETDPNQFLTRGTAGFDSRFYRTHTYYTTFTFLNHFKENGEPVVVTSRETVSNVLTLPVSAITPSSTRFETETYLTTYTYYKTTTRGDREQVASTQEVVTQIVVTEAPAVPPATTATPTRSLLFTKTYLSTVTLFDTALVSGEQVIVSSTSVVKDVAIETSYFPNTRPTLTRPPIRATAAPTQRPSLKPTPVVDSSLLPVGEQDEIHVVATRTFYTTSTFYTTLLEGSSTVVRTRTEVTSRVQTEKVTTRLDPSHLSSFRGSLSASAPPSTLSPSATKSQPLKVSTLELAGTGPASTSAAAPTGLVAETTPQPTPSPTASGPSTDEEAAVDLKVSVTGVDRVDDVTNQPDEVPATSEPVSQQDDLDDDPEQLSPADFLSSSVTPSPSPAVTEQEEDSLVTAGSFLSATTVSPDPLDGASSSDSGTSSSSAETSTESTAASLGNLAGSLLGLSGLAAGSLNLGSMVDTAAGLFRNVLPLAVRREDNTPARPPPAVHVQQRNPAFIPVGGVAASLRRNQHTLATRPAPGGGFIAVQGPNGQLIPLRGVPDAGPSHRRQPPPGQQGDFSGPPRRRADGPRRPGPGGRPGAPQRTNLPPRGGQKSPPFRKEGPRLPGRPQFPNRRAQQQQHLAKPNGFIAVFPGQRGPPHQQQNGFEGQNTFQGQHFEGGFQGQDVRFPTRTEGGFVELNRGDQGAPGEPFQVHVRPFQNQNQRQRVDVGPGPHRRPRPGLEPPPPHELTPIFEGPDFEDPPMEHFGAADGRQPFPSRGAAHEFGPGVSTRVRVSITSGVQTQFINPPSVGPDGAPISVPPAPRPVVVVGASVPPGFDQPSFDETSRIDVSGISDESAPSYIDGEFLDESADDDQEYAASVQGPFGAGQLTYFSNEDFNFERNREQNAVQPDGQYVPEEVLPARQPPPVQSRPTLHTIAQLEGSNRIVGTNVFANVVPITTKPAVITISFPRETERPPPPPPAPVFVPVRTRFTPATTQVASQPTPATETKSVVNKPAPEARPGTGGFNPYFAAEASTTEQSELLFETPTSAPPDTDLELSASTEQLEPVGSPRKEQTSSSIIGDEENDKINFIVSSSFDEIPTTSAPSSDTTSSRTPSLSSSRRPSRLADRIRQTLLASLSSAAAEAALSSTSHHVETGASTAILGPDVRTLESDTRVTRKPGGTETVIQGESTVFGGLFTRPALPVHQVHDITEIVHGSGDQPVTKYITRTEQFTRTVTATKTDIRFEGSSVVTSTKIITSTLPPITIVSTVVGTATQVHTLNTATRTQVRPLPSNTRSSSSVKSRLPPPPPPPPRHRPDEITIAGVYTPDSIELADVRKGVSDDNEVNRVVISPGADQGLVVEQVEAVATLCQRPCLPDIFETCRRVDDEYRCACRPGYARTREQDPCEPTLTYRLQVLLDRVNDIPLSFRPSFGDSASVEFRQMSRLTEAGLAEALSSTPLSERLHTARLMSFQRSRSAEDPIGRRQKGLLAELMVQVSDRKSQSMDKAYLQDVVQQALSSTNYSLGGREVVVARHVDAVTALDFDECEDAEYNDCHEQAFCYNLVGTFTCSCRDGMIDTDVTEMPGRVCTAESTGCPECSYSGECYTRDEGTTGCRCHRWYAGNRCQINLRVLLIALVTVGVVLALMLCACCFLCCRRKSRAHVAPPLVFTGPAGFLRHRGTSLHNPVLERRAMLDSSSDTSVPSPSRRGAVQPAAKRKAPTPRPPADERGRKSGHTNASFQEDRSMASTGVQPPVFIPRARHKHPARPNSVASSAVRVGPDGTADLRSSQSRLMSVLEPRRRGRSRSGGTFTSQRTSRSASGGRRDGRDEVSRQPTGRSRSSDNVSHRVAESAADGGEYGTHAFFRERTMSEARSFDETTIRPSVRSMRGFGTQRSQLSSNQNTYDHHTMAERDAASTFVMPETQLFRPSQDSDVQSELSLAEDFPQIHAGSRGSRPHSTVGSRRTHR